jgi:hypothetical protein
LRNGDKISLLLSGHVDKIAGFAAFPLYERRPHASAAFENEKRARYRQEGARHEATTESDLP